MYNAVHLTEIQGKNVSKRTLFAAAINTGNPPLITTDFRR